MGIYNNWFSKRARVEDDPGSPETPEGEVVLEVLDPVDDDIEPDSDEADDDE